MYVDVIIWDDENEPHITGPGEVTAEDVEKRFIAIRAAMTIRTITAPRPSCRSFLATLRRASTSWWYSRI